MIAQQIELFNPFSLNSISFWQKLLVRSERCGTGGGALYRRLFLLGRKLMPHIMGDAEVELEGIRKMFSYSVFNTQYHSLYDPLYAFGYEPETSNLIRLLLLNAKHFVDVGSNWGYYPIYARACGFKGKITAFEPQRDVFQEMKSIVDQLGLAENIELVNKAVAGREMMVDVVIPDGLHSGLCEIREGGGIDAVPLGNWVDEHPDVIKIDAEGFEAEVLGGAVKILQKCRPYVLFESWRNSSDVKMTMRPFDILAEHEYVFYQPALLKQVKTGVLPLLYGEYWDLEKEMELALIPFDAAQRFMLKRQFDVFACPKEKAKDLLDCFQT